MNSKKQKNIKEYKQRGGGGGHTLAAENLQFSTPLPPKDVFGTFPENEY